MPDTDEGGDAACPMPPSSAGAEVSSSPVGDTVVAESLKRSTDQASLGDDAAAKRRALEEFKRAALARILAESEEADDPFGTEGTGDVSLTSGGDVAEGQSKGVDAGDDGGEEEGALAADCPVADLDIVEFLREEADAAVGEMLDSTRELQRPGLVCEKAAVYERREPKQTISSAIVAVKSDAASPSAAALPPGARQAPKSMGHWVAQGGDGGVTFNANQQRRAHHPGQAAYTAQQGKPSSEAASASNLVSTPAAALLATSAASATPLAPVAPLGSVASLTPLSASPRPQPALRPKQFAPAPRLPASSAAQRPGLGFNPGNAPAPRVQQYGAAAQHAAAPQYVAPQHVAPRPRPQWMPAPRAW